MRSNFVAKNAHKENRAAVHRDRKQQQKRGYVKHKRSQTWHNSFQTLYCTDIVKKEGNL